jgi:hypothetical protein
MRFIIGSRSYGYLWIACSVTLVIPAAGPRGGNPAGKFSL